MTKQTHKLYDGEMKLVYNDDDHSYKVDDEIVYGVTSITDVLHKPALMYYAVNCGINHLEDNWEPGEEDEISKKELLEQAKRAHKDISRNATDIGGELHDWAEHHFNSDMEDKGEPKNESLKRAARALLKWEQKHDIEVIDTERKVFSKKHWYAGTLDLVAKIDGKLTVLDFKTSKSIYNNYYMQVAAYAQAYKEEFEQPEQTAILRVDKNNGEFEYKTVEDTSKHLKGFLGAKKLYEWERWIKSVNITEKYGN